MPQIRSLLVDADGVIQLPSSSWRKSLESLCSDPSRIDEFVSEIFAAEQPCLTGTGDFASALTEVLANWDSPASTQQALDVWTLIEPDKDILSLLSGLRDRGLSVSLASNQQGHRASFMRDQLGYCDLFDELLFSCDIGLLNCTEYWSNITKYLHWIFTRLSVNKCGRINGWFFHMRVNSLCKNQINIRCKLTPKWLCLRHRRPSWSEGSF